MMKHKFVALAFVAFLFAVGIVPTTGQQQPQRSAADQEKVEALKDMLNTGLLTQQEYDAKLRELNAGAGAPNPGSAPSMKVFRIFDPVLGMDFFTITLPSNWMFQGGLVRQSSCSVLVSHYFRASGPAGLYGIKMLPRFDWGWSNNAQYTPGPESNCLPYDRPIPAADFLQYMVKLLHVEYMKDLTTEAEREANRKRTANPGPAGPTFQTWEVARALTRFKINSIQEEEVVGVEVSCAYNTWIRPSRIVPSHRCAAWVTLTWAPEGKAESTDAMLRPMITGGVNPAWYQRSKQVEDQQTALSIAQITARGEATRHQMDLSFKQHEDFMATMQRGSDRNLEDQKHIWSGQQRMADDWCDYALGLQKRYNPETGQLYKSSSASTYDWVSSDGRQHYPTNDINDNPNGRLPGSWTLTNNVH